MYEYAASLLRVVDGDTVDLDVDLGFTVRHKMRVRLYGIDAPERGQDGWALARDGLADILGFGARLQIRTYRDRADSFGRYLADIYNLVLDPPDHVNAHMIESGFAVPYTR